MKTELSNFLSNRWAAAVFTVLFVAFLIFVLPAQAKLAAQYGDAGQGPDTSLYYSAETLYAMAGTLGEEGRAFYVKQRWTFDVVWPFVYTSFLLSTTLACARRLPYWQTRLGWLSAIPLAGVTLDFVENTSASIIMVRYSATTPVVEHLSGLATFSKWLFVVGSFLLLFWLLGSVLLRKALN